MSKLISYKGSKIVFEKEKKIVFSYIYIKFYADADTETLYPERLKEFISEVCKMYLIA